MKAAVEAAETHTGTIEGASVQNVITTTIDPNSWRLDSLHHAMTKTEATSDQKIDGTVAKIDGTVETTVETAKIAANIVIATRGRTGASHGHNLSDHSKKRWTLIADSTCTRGTTENCDPITR
jgi:hypothetical protein